MRNDARDDFEHVPTLRAEAHDHDELAPTDGARERTTVYSRNTPVIKVKGPSTGPLWTLICALLFAVGGLAWWSFQQISLMEQQLVATQESFARISEDAAGRLQAISGKVVASESSINNGSEALKLQIKQLEEQLLEQSKRQQGVVAGQQGELDQRFEQINAAMVLQVTAQKETQARLEAELKGLGTELSTLKASVAQQAVDVAALKKQGNPSAAVERLEQDMIVLKSELENRPAPAHGANAAEFDVFRAQMTRNINTLQSQIQNLQKQISARP
ncbi:ATPase [Pseudomonas psychrophila]|uniref:ATPase n=1 Tax=Pseudomonas psychrophila TaxID=122355 RepID=UPI00062A4F63|nr:ATPase [Pseudomonas psychrophila]KOX66420.1 ATPase [Pseudomonas psychrophila]